MTNNNLKPAVAYIRVSTDGQVGDDKYGLDAQRGQILEYAEKNGYEILDWYIDEGVSGVKESRPAFDRIIYGEVSNPPVSTVIVAKTDRVARDINVYFYYKMMLKKKNITLVSISEDFGQFGVFSSILEAFTLCVAEMERENIMKRTRLGRYEKAKTGGYSGGRPPYGYKVVDNELEIIPEEAEVVREIYQMRKEGKILKEIAGALNARGLKTHTGKPFNTSTIQVILNNKKTYQGYYQYGESDWIQGIHEPILDLND